MSQELKACPFCGSSAQQNIISNGFGVFVKCESCESSGPVCETELKAIEHWNRRATDPRASKSNISEYVEMLIGKPDPRDKVIRLCEKALESTIASSPDPYCAITRKLKQLQDEALAAIKSITA